MRDQLQDATGRADGLNGAGQRLVIAGWTLEVASGRMRSGEGEEVQLEPKAMQVLQYLARHPGRVVSRRELEASVWEGRVVGYDAVTNTIIKLRKAFRDDARAPRVIETLSRRGYRLLAEVRTLEPGREHPPATGTVARPGVRHPRPVLLATLLLVMVGLAWWRPWDSGPVVAPGEVQTPSAIPSIVVLPFEHLGDDPEQRYFSNGITEDLTTDLAQIPALRVIARNSALGYSREDSPQRIGRELGVRYVLQGSVRRSGDRIRINTWLIDTTDGRHLWAERLDGTLAETFTLQDALTHRIAAALRLRIAAPGQELRRHDVGIEAYDHFLRGKDYLGRLALDDLEAARLEFERAIALDPGFARAYANLALVYLRHAIEGWQEDTGAMLERARTLAQQALALDDGVPELHFVRAFVALFDRRHLDAVEDLQRALRLRPSYADAYALSAWVLHFAGRDAEALEALARAMELNPRVPAAYLLVQAELEFSLYRYAQAVALLERANQMNPAHPRILLLLAAAYAGAGRGQDAGWIVQELLLLHPALSLSRLHEAFPFREAARMEHLQRALQAAGVPG